MYCHPHTSICKCIYIYYIYTDTGTHICFMCKQLSKGILYPLAVKSTHRTGSSSLKGAVRSGRLPSFCRCAIITSLYIYIYIYVYIHTHTPLWLTGGKKKKSNIYHSVSDYRWFTKLTGSLPVSGWAHLGAQVRVVSPSRSISRSHHMKTASTVPHT